jgi:L-ascorbate metabolism protein UlaG (beta-lactamase superfamily)
VKPSDHFDGQRFRNPRNVRTPPFSAVPKMLAEPGAPWPASVPVTPRVPPPLGNAAAVVTFIGHATFLIQTAAGNVLTDPVYSNAAGPWGRFGPRRSRLPGVRFDDLPPIATILLSHNHYDHCDRTTLRALARRFSPRVLTPLGNRRLARSMGFDRIEELDWWDCSEAAGLPITLTPAQHFSARTPFDRNRALWGGFMLQIGDRRLYFAGDSGYGDFFKDIGDRFGPIDLALIPIGAYEPRWFMRPIHMDPDEAVRAHRDVRSKRSIGMHFGTFRMTTEAIDAPLIALAQARRDHNVAPAEFTTLDFGGSTEL